MEDFVIPHVDRLTLEDGETIDVKRRLSHGETEDLLARIFGEGVTNRREVRTARIVAYLIGWSLTKDGAPVPMAPNLPDQARTDTIRALDPDRAVEIYDAIIKHEDAQAAARAAEKKTRAGARAAATTSPSPSEPAGASSGSAPSTSTTTPS